MSRMRAGPAEKTVWSCDFLQQTPKPDDFCMVQRIAPKTSVESGPETTEQE